MTIKLRQSTASQEVPLGYFVDSTDGNTEETALSIANTDIKLWKMGATTLANKNSGGATHISNGVYYCVLDATDTNTLGALIIFVHVSGALAVRVECEVLAANVYDALIAASDNLQVDTVQIGGTTQTAGDIMADTNDIQSRLPAALVSGRMDASVGAIASGVDLSATMKTSVNAEVVDALNTDTYAEPGQATPSATATLAAKINYLYKAWRNKKTQTATTFSLFNDDAATVDQKATVSDDGTTTTVGEIATGP